MMSDSLTQKSIEISSDDKLYALLLHWIATHSPDAKSFACSSVNSRRSYEDSDDEESEDSDAPDHNSKRVTIKLGFGNYTFVDNNGLEFKAVHRSVGDPVGTNCCAELYKVLYVITDDDRLDTLKDFLDFLINQSEKTRPGVIDVRTWDIRRQYWRSRSTIRARALDSVILPSKTKMQIVSDIERFLSKKTKEFYGFHGIPYRRCYLLHGVPGAGKTSLIQAIAGHFKRSISFLQPTHADMSDDSLAAAMAELPRNTVAVLEDIDALFDKDRTSKVSKSCLTFSGLLNALDGIGSTSGQLIFMTTNLRDQLDPALIRNGRVDFHIHFDYASDEQIEEMWATYYPSDTHLASVFCANLRSKLEGKPIATAGLQHFFVLHMNSSAEEAVDQVDVIIEDMKQKAVESTSADIKEKEEGAEISKPRDSEATSLSSASGSTEDESAVSKVGGLLVKTISAAPSATGAEGAKDVHIYIHLPNLVTGAVKPESITIELPSPIAAVSADP